MEEAEPTGPDRVRKTSTHRAVVLILSTNTRAMAFFCYFITSFINICFYIIINIVKAALLKYGL